MNSKRITFAVLISLVLAVVFPLGLRAQESGRTGRRREPGDSRLISSALLERAESEFLQKQVQQKLRNKIEKVHYEDVPLSEVLDDLRGHSGLNIHVNWQSLSAEGIERTQPITMQLHDVSVQKALRVILDNLSAGFYAAPLGYVVDENVITIASKADLARAAEAEFPKEKAKQTEMKLDLIDRLQKVCLDPAAVAMIASAGLKDDVSRSRAEITEDLEAQLAETKTLGLRNAIRLTLRDLYKTTGNNEKVLEHLRAMLTENDAAIDQEASRAYQEITRLKAEMLSLQSEALKRTAQIEQLQARLTEQAEQIEVLKKQLAD